MHALEQANNRVVGTKQVLRSLEAGTLLRAYIAQDADAHLREKILGHCQRNNVPVEFIGSMAEMGRLCGIEVGSAAAGIVRQSE
ncbi:ribosomal L7Ae/L30e/S12e/Gadd45 family protein [Eubacteriales bacterium OttesenSCG-928-N14]|nr:ribosomal L7Ae/L30e/S12e/Gadd45 family protein [Eubacteriales bacterium OttesenSCG-928-N14]